ncbi:N-acetyl-gamma-glutamyl-phosphate reductase, partial [bacterium]|nr:N-acetyl-gamma-glutamyl-phosphate reductase [bacterium]
MKNLKVGIFGISGYAGQKLVEILVNHPEVEITLGFVAPDEGNPEIEEIIPKLKGIFSLKCKNEVDWDEIEKKCNFVFLA